jgi:hypothetical protein
MADEAKKPVQDEPEMKELELDGYKFKVDLDLLDDADAFALINKIENENQVTAIVPLMNFLIGEEAFAELRAYFTQKDAEAHKDVKGYKPRLRIGKLGEIYQVIIESFDPKG